MEPCNFPRLESSQVKDDGMLFLPVKISAGKQLVEKSEKDKRAFISIIQTVWSLVLHCYTGLSDVNFNWEEFSSDELGSVPSFRQTTRIQLPQEGTLEDLIQIAANGYETASTHHQSSKYGDDYVRYNNTTVKLYSSQVDRGINSHRGCKSLDNEENRIFLILHTYPTSINITLHWPKKWMGVSQAKSVSGTITQILDCALSQPMQLISGADWLSDHDRKMLLHWNGHGLSESNRTLHSTIAFQTQLHSDSEAVCAWDGSLTYEELDEASEKLASVLQSKGVGTGVNVPFCFDKSKFAVVCMLAILKTGGAFVPLDPKNPRARLQRLIEKVDASVVLCGPEYRPLILGMAENVIPVNETFLENLPFETLDSVASSKASDRAYVIFTSGSTGEPKAVIIQHSAIMSSIEAHGKALGFSPNTRSLQFSAYVWDVSICDIFTTLCYGGCVCIPSEYDRINALEKTINSMNVNFACMTPTICKMIDPTAVPGLANLLLIGEAMTAAIVEAWCDRILINSYGPAEASVMCHLNFPMTPKKSPMCFGYPVGVRAWIADRNNHHRLMPLGSVGELLLEGPLLSQGYYKDEKKTSEAYIMDPAWTLRQPELGQFRRFYKTGDLARYNPDGSYEFAGRKDTQIKFHGQRIELAEIEFNIQRSTTIKHAMVLLPKAGHCSGHLVTILHLVKPDGTNMFPDGRPLSIVAPKNNQAVGAMIQQYKAGLRTHLPEYMIPGIWVVVESIPFVSSGKLDRTRISRWVSEMNEEQYESVQALASSDTGQDVKNYPANQLEQTMRSIWSSVLNKELDRIAYNRPFLSYGGDSLSSMQVAGTCRRQGIDVSVQDVLRSSSIIELCASVKTSTVKDEDLLIRRIDRDSSRYSVKRLSKESLQELEQKLSDLNLKADDIEEVYPCLALQQGILLGRSRSLETYAAHAVYEIKPIRTERIDIYRLLQAWQLVIDRHALLRTVFLDGLREHNSVNDQAVLKTYRPHIVPLEAADDDKAVKQLLQQTSTGYDDGTSPLHRFSVCVSSTGKVFCNLDISHAIMDGASISIMLRDMTLAYSDLLSLQERPLYSTWLSFLSTYDATRALTYWKDYLTGAEPCHFPLLIDGHASERKPKPIRINFEHTSQLQNFCDSNGFTLSNAFHAAWALTLRSYTRSEEVVFGYISSGRDPIIAESEQVVGPYINLITCRLRVGGETSLKDVLLKTQKDHLAALPYQHVSMAEVQNALHMTDNALFNTIISYRKVPSTSIPQAQIEFVEVIPTFDPDEYNISINIEAHHKTMAIDFGYWTHCLCEAQARNVADTFERALIAVAYESYRPINQLLHLGQYQMQQLAKWNLNMPEAINECVHDSICSQSLARPGAAAIDSWDGKYTYSKLDQQSTLLARHLKKSGVARGRPVMLCFNKSAYAIIAAIAVLKSGGICVPLDAAYPRPAMEVRAHDAGAKHAIVGADCATVLHGLIEKVVVLDSDFLHGLPDERHSPDGVQPEDACFIIYTSGSTGKPKGVVLEHRHLVTSSAYFGPLFGFGKDSRVFQFASYTFDNSLAEIYTTLMRGGCVCIPSDQERLNDMGGTMNRMRVTYADITPSVAALVNPKDVPTLKRLMLGAEAISKKVVDIWKDYVSIAGGYGPSECTINSAYSDDISSPGQAANIGVGCGCFLWIVDADDHNKLAPIGASGELLVEGPILARGYLNDEEKTAKAFITDPHWVEQMPLAKSIHQTRRMYKTGDLARYDSNGTVQYLGRLDSQVKFNGQRIELGEIEHQLQRCLPQETPCAVELVTLGNLPDAKKELAAFVCTSKYESIPRASETATGLLELSSEMIKQFKSATSTLSKVIQSYMVPTAWLPMEKLPLSSAGKLNRRHLRSVASSIPSEHVKTYRLSGKSGRTPTTATELKLAALWATVIGLDVSAIGAEDNFFRLGGNSLVAMRMVSAARAQDMHLSVNDVFQNSTLEGMALLLEGKSNQKAIMSADIKPFTLAPKDLNLSDLKADIAERLGIDTRAILDIYPCTAMQAGLISLSAKSPGAYVALMSFDLAEDVDVDRLCQAWQTVSQVESSLRTRIVLIGTQDFYSVVTNDSIEWENVACLEDLPKDFGLLPAAEGDKLVSFAVIGEGTSHVQLAIFIHHALYDGWSWPLLLAKVKAAYDHDGMGQIPRSPKYANFINYIQGIDPYTSDEFWRTAFAGIASTQFPKLPSSSYHANASSIFEDTIWVQTSTSSGITIASTIRSAWALVVAAYSGNEEVTFLETLSGRDVDVEGVEEIIGATITTIPNRVRINRKAKFSEFLRSVQSQSIEARPHQHAGLQRIKQLSNNAALACEAQSLIAVNHGQYYEDELFKMSKADASSEANFYTYPLMMSLFVEPESISIEAHYDSNIISKWLMERIFHHFQYVLVRLMDRNLEDNQLEELRVPSLVDVKTMESWNSKPILVYNNCIHELISLHARSGDGIRPAICAWDLQLSHEELERLSTTLAWELSDIGVRPKSVVPLYFEKSGFTLIAALAVLKCGATFLLLSPDQPQSRLEYIVENIEARIMLCSSRYTEYCKRLVPIVAAIDQDMLNKLPAKKTLPATASSNDIAYIIFTSGTTGRPKGTIISHSAFCTSAHAHAPVVGIDKNSRSLNFASYTFDAGITEIFTTLIMGGCVCIPDDFSRLNDITKPMNEMKVNWTLLTPSFVQTIMPDQVPCLKTLTLGGEAPSAAHINTWNHRLKLINVYGPSEASVIATINSDLSLEAGPTNMGYPTGCRCWVVDAADHNRLVPLGCIGELLLDGPILAQGYLKDEAKTKAAFIRPPPWLSRFGSLDDSDKPLYKTGDLVKYAEDGSLIFVGRKDTQVKVHGQRVELGEIEENLGSEPAIVHCMMVLPKSGLFRKKLVAIMSLKETVKPSNPGDPLRTVDNKAVTPILKKLRQRIGMLLPAYMNPSHYVILESLPLLPSGKIDRNLLTGYVQNADEDVYRQVLDLQSSAESIGRDATTTETRLRDMFAGVLSLTSKNIGLTQSFLSLGGDSLQAMSLLSKCRSAGLGLKIQDILSSKSLVELAKTVVKPKEVVQNEEQTDKEFALSPIQKFYFEVVGDYWQHFNQSFAFYLQKSIQPQKIKNALEKVLVAHPMLRARFLRKAAGEWCQTISKDVSTSLKFVVHENPMSTEQITNQAAISAKLPNIIDGPLVIVDLFKHTENQLQLVSICAHHLVIDIVSWRILTSDLENTLKDDSSSPQAEIVTFQKWSRLQLERARQTVVQSVLEIQDVPIADLSYWGMQDVLDRSGDVVERTFELDPHTTSQLLSDCNQALNTEFVDILIASILYSFAKTFSDRDEIPALYNEGHGREAWDDIDVSQTIGWFTTLTPLHLPSNAKAEDNIIKCVRWIKDLRRATPGKGRPYFAYRQLTDIGRATFARHWPMEMAFNYLGQTQATATDDSLLLPISADLQSKFPSDVGSDVPRLSFFDIAAALYGTRLRFSFSYNKAAKHQDKIKNWVAKCQSTLVDVASALTKLARQETMSLFPLLPLTWNGIEKIQKALPTLGISSLADVEDIYPCSPMQKGMLLSQVKDPLNYSFQIVFKLSQKEADQNIDVERLTKAWNLVVKQHHSLRTIFMDELTGPGSTAQVVLKHHTPRILFHEDEDDAVSKTLTKAAAPDYSEHVPPHRLTISKTRSGATFCRLDMSHTIIDGASMALLYEELSLAYANCQLSIPAPYRDYVRYLQSQSSDLDMDYWKKNLASVEPCLFPSLTDGKQRERELQCLDLDIPLSSEILTYCKSNEVTLSTLLQLTWALVLRVYTGNNDVSFGYLVSGRDAPVDGIEKTIGVFINMLTCRFNLQDDLYVKAALQTTQADLSVGMSHQSVPLADIQHAVNLGAPIFNTVFSLQKQSSSANETAGELSYDFLDGEDPSEFHLTINIEVSEKNLGISFTYWSNTMSSAQISGVSLVFEQILRDLVSHNTEQTLLGQIDCISSYNIRQIHHFNSKPLPRIEDCVHRIFTQHAKTRPLADAFDGHDGNYSYAELDAVTDRLAKHLMTLGVQVGDFIPLSFEKSVFMGISMLGVMKAGAAFVPIAPDVPEARLEFLLENVKASIVLCSESLIAKISGKAKQAFAVSKSSLDQLPLANSQPLAIVGPRDMAYAIFTSGTTGVPKGTIIEHGAFCTGGTEHAKAMFMNKDSRTLQFASYTFDASVMEILSSLLVGGCVCFPTDHERMSDIPGVIERMKITWTLLTPSVANILKPGSVSNLRTLVTGGEAMSRDHIQKWAGTGIALVNAYGPSECSVVATTHTKVDEKGQQLDSEPANIGFAVGSRCWVVNPNNHDQLVPTGAIGELLVEGRITARCYLANEEKTKAAFVASPAWTKRSELASIFQEQERMYKTGDLVRCNSDGSFNYVARKDTQIKLNGQRIEVAEIEHHVKENLPETSQAAVDLVTPAGARRVLAVFFTSESRPSIESHNDEILLSMDASTTANAVAVQLGLKSALPAYMVPTIYIPVTSMPWTASGKLDRTRLKNIVAKLSKDEIGAYKIGAGTASAKQLPQTEMEEKLQAFWAEALEIKTDSIGAADNFFRLGGDSISGMKLVNIAAAHQISLATIDVFRNPKLSDMAEMCSALKSTSDNFVEPFVLLPEVLAKDEVLEEVALMCQVPEHQIQDAYPCSRLQEGLLALSVKQAGAYVARYVFKLPQSIQLQTFKAAWQKTVDETDILRTRIPHGETFGFMQVVLKQHDLCWQSFDRLEGTEEQIQLPDSNGGSLTRYYIVENSTSRYFVFLIHHSLYDGWSLPIILQRVEENYLSLSTNVVNKDVLPPAPYVNFIQFLQETSLEASDDFWITKLSDSSWASHFPASKQVDEESKDTQKQSHTSIIRRDSNKLGVTLPVVLRAAWALLLSTYTNSDSVLFGETLAARDVPVHRITDICGPTLTTVPQKIRIDRALTVQQYLQSVQRLSTDLIPYQHAGLQHIKRLSPDTTAACDFQNLLVVQTPQDDSEDSIWQPEGTEAGANFFTYPLVLECNIRAGEVHFEAHHDASVLSGQQVTRILSHFDQVIQQFNVNMLYKRVTDINIFGARDLEAIKAFRRQAQGCWIVDPHDMHKLAPFGAVGELLVEEAQIAGRKSLIESFAELDWMSSVGLESTILYKTGHLARHNIDGSVSDLGEKTNQLRLHGQHIDLMEIERLIQQRPQIRQVVAAIPKSGPFAKELVAVVTITAMPSISLPEDTLVLIEDETRLTEARSRLEKAQVQISEELPAHMRPAMWVMVEDIPFNDAKSIDREKVFTWLAEADAVTYRQVLESNSGSSSGENEGETVAIIRKVWAEIFGVPPETIRDHDSYLSLGGDSISAMSVMSRCRKEGITVSLQDVLRSKSIVSLARKIKSKAPILTQAGNKPEIMSEAFELSPIQKLYFEFIDPAGRSQFNQSQFVSITKRLEPSAVHAALKKLIQHHSMLRARFVKGTDGWNQKITDDVNGSYRFNSMSCSQQGLIQEIERVQGSMNVIDGPVVGCTLFENKFSKAQNLFIAIHHLVVDAVSWAPILQDLEALLTNGSDQLSSGSISFQTWTQLQSNQAENIGAEEIPKMMPIKARVADLDYWSMSNQTNVYGDTETRTFELDLDVSSLVLGSANNAFNTEPIDLLISAIAESFRAIFSDRLLPPVFNESHGREWDSSIDLSSTVGWFTTVTPIQLKPKTEDGPLQIVKLVKDVRRNIPFNGRPYFAYRNSQISQTRFRDHLPVEILFNYLGRSGSAGKIDTLFKDSGLPTDSATQTKISDVGTSTTRLALFEISAGVSNGKINFSFIFNKKVNHVDKVRDWVECCQSTLQAIVESLAVSSREPTLTDFPLLPISYGDLPKIMSRSLPKAGIKDLDLVEDIYPCSPTQEGVLLSQLRAPSSYIFHEINEVIPKVSPVDPTRLIDAWNQVVARHPILRSVFTDSFYKGGNFDQIVLKSTATGAIFVRESANDDEDAMRILRCVKIQDHNYSRTPRLPHQMSIVRTKAGKVFMKLEMTHAVIDGASSANILRDIALAYEGRLDPQGPLYSDYISFIRKQTPTSSIRHFKSYLAGIEPCLFPNLNRTDDRQLNHVVVDFDSYSQLLVICKDLNVTLASIMQAAYAILLRSYVKTNDVSFGYLTSGRDSPVNRIQDAVGLFINMLICRVQFDEEIQLGTLFSRVQNDYLEMLPFQHSSLAKVQHELNLDGKTLFNTAVSIQGSAGTTSTGHQPTEIVFEALAARDPSEYAVTANIFVKPGDEACLFRYWTNHLSDEQAKDMAVKMSNILHSITKDPHQLLRNLTVTAVPRLREIQAKSSVVSFKEEVEEVMPERIRSHSTARSSSRLSRESSRSTIPTPDSLHSPVQLQSMIRSAVQDAIEQMFKSGKIVLSHNASSTAPSSFSNSSMAPLSVPSTVPSSETSSADVGLPVEDGLVKKIASKVIMQGPTDEILKVNKTVHKEIEVFPTTQDDHTDRLRLLWSEILEISADAIEADHNFFEMNGDSIDAMEMAGLARENGLSLTVASIFQHPVFKDMAKQVHDLSETVRVEKVTTQYQKEYQKDYGITTQKGVQKETRRESVSRSPVVDTYLPFSLLQVPDVYTFLQDHVCPKVNTFRGGIQDVLPVTDFQAGCIAGTLLDSRFTLNYFFLDGNGRLDMSKLRDGVASIIQLHDVFRTVYIQYKAKFLQVILRTMAPTIDLYEADDLDKFVKQMRENDIVNDQPRLGTPFAQFSVVKKKDFDQHRIVIRLSHAQYDGISFDKILTHLKQAYEGQPQTSAPSYTSFLHNAFGGYREAHHMYWSNLLAGSSITEVVKRHKPNLNRGDAKSRTLNKMANLPNLASYNLTDATIVKAAWALVLCQLTCKTDVVFGQLINGRTAAVEGIENIVGPCLNYTPVRVKLEPNLSYLNVLHMVHEQHISSMPYENLGFSELVDKCANWKKWVGFSTIVHHMNVTEHSEWSMGGLPYKVGAVGSGSNTDDFEIVSRARPGNKVDIELTYANDGLIHPNFAMKVLDMLCSTIEVMSEPKTKLPNWSSVPAQTIHAEPLAEDKSVVSILESLDDKRLSAARHVVQEAWSTTSEGEVLESSNFFDLGNDFVSAAITSLIFAQRGYDVSFDTILDNPSMRHHMALIAAQQRHEVDSGSETSTLNGQEGQSGSTDHRTTSRWRQRVNAVVNAVKRPRGRQRERERRL